MTAGALKFDPQMAGHGTVPGSFFASEFRNHLMPHQVTRAVRREMVRALAYEQAIWSALVVSTCVMFGGVVVFVFLERGLPLSMQLDAVRPAFLAALIALLMLHCHYRSQRQFVSTAPAAGALVVRVKEPLRFDEDRSLAVPRLLLRYLPRPPEEENADALQTAPNAHTMWAQLDGFSARFERTVHAGDYVSILYEPSDPLHVRVVELEREVG